MSKHNSGKSKKIGKTSEEKKYPAKAINDGPLVRKKTGSGGGLPRK